MNDKKITLIPDGIDLFYWMRDYAKQNDKGEWFCDGELKSEISFPPISIEFSNISEKYEIFDYVDWGGWNECPHAGEMKKKSKEWFENYGAELYFMTNDVLKYQCNRKLEEEEIETFIADITDFCPGSLEMYHKPRMEEMKRILKEKQKFYLWWD